MSDHSQASRAPGGASRLAVVAGAGLAGGAVAQLGELLWAGAPLRAGEAVALTAGVALLGVAVAAALAAAGRALGNRRKRPAPALPLAAATAVLLWGLVLAWFLGLVLPVGSLRAVTFGAPLAGLVAAGLVAVGVRAGSGRPGAVGAVFRALDRVVPGLPAAALAAAAAFGFAANGAPGAAVAGSALALAAGGGAAWVGRRRPGLGVAASLAACGLLTASAWLGPATPPVPPEPAPVAPGSVLWIVLDTVRADHLEPYGAPVGQTPTLARLAAEGTVFTGVASPSPWTVPSHASMLTGLPPRSHGSWYGHRPYLEDAFETLPERYRAAGFETAAFYTNGWLRVANLLQGFDVAEDTVRRPLNKLTAVRALTYLGLGPEPWIDKGAHHTVAAVSRWLAARDADRPFLLFLNLFEAHSPYLPPARYRKLPEGIGPLDAIRAHRGFDPVRWHAEGRSGGARVRAIRALYRAGVHYQDAMLGELLDAVAARVALDDLVVVVTADHGENLGERGSWGHLFALDEALIHVPLLVRAPGRFPAGARVEAAFQLQDLFSSLAALSGVDASAPAALHRIDPDDPGREATFAEAYPAWPRLAEREGAPPSRRVLDMAWPMASVRADGRKLTVWESGSLRLVDPDRDPSEASDLAAAEPDRARALLGALERWRAAHRLHRPAEGAAGEGVSPEVQEMLRQLGYL